MDTGVINGEQTGHPAQSDAPETQHQDTGKANDSLAPLAADHNAAQQPYDVDSPVPDSDIPWRNMPSLPSAEPLAAGSLPEATRPADGTNDPIADMEPVPDSVWDKAIPDAEVHAGDDAQYELVLGVKLRQYGPVFFFRAGQENIRPGVKVLVETENGLGLAQVVSARKLKLPLPLIRSEKGDFPINPIVSLAGPEDIAAAADNQILASSAKLYCKECIRERALDMKLVDVEVLHDRSKIIFYFTAPTRIDFRELVKDLVRNYHTRIELRQIGVRHETQMLGALGNCGMTCCCRRYLRKFAPVTIRMAKEQNLFLNPAKLSGICGRLLCCLAYEQENYEDFHKRSPQIGKRYSIGEGQCKVLRANMFRQSIFILTDANEEKELTLDEWEALNPSRVETSGPGTQPVENDRRGRGRERKDTRAPRHADAERKNKNAPVAEGSDDEAALQALTDESMDDAGQPQRRNARAQRQNGHGAQGQDARTQGRMQKRPPTRERREDSRTTPQDAKQNNAILTGYSNATLAHNQQETPEHAQPADTADDGSIFGLKNRNTASHGETPSPPGEHNHQASPQRSPEDKRVQPKPQGDHEA